ncbi:hypothetical protein RI129_007016 [Pyrocoelia pectoralis]|uniref:Uncharacterized protein n=1 Tax=Pyrocoelia pectoralis TaxID=417401 RepID=A0AAN7VDM9_9COLE
MNRKIFKSMIGRYNGLVARLRLKVADSNNCPPKAFRCIIHQQHFCTKQLNLDHAMTVSRPVKEFLKKIECEYGDVLYHSEVRWLSRGKVSKRFFDLRHETTEKLNPVPEFRDPLWLWELAILCDLMQCLNDLYIKLQWKNKLICHVYADVNAFQAKLQLFIQQAEREILVHFPTRMIELLRLLSDHFDERFADCHELKNDIRVFENPFSIDVSTAPIELQLELIENEDDYCICQHIRMRTNFLGVEESQTVSAFTYDR